MRLIGLVILMTVPPVALPVFAQPPDLFAERSLTYSGGPWKEETFRYRLHVPDLEPGERVPVILFLHGAGERGDDNVSQLTHFPNLWRQDVYRERFKAFIVAPQCRKGHRWVEVPWSATRSAPLPATLSPMLAVALAALDRTLADHPVDQDRVYLTGLSMGGFGAWYLAARHPDRFAAVAPVCGGGPEEQAARLKDIPIWAWHGADDRAVPPARSRNMIQKIRDAGGTPRHTELEGVGHASWTAAYALDGVLPWMWEQRRASKTPSWATVLEERPSRTVVKDAEGRRRMEATGLPWRVKDKDGIEYLLIPPGRYLRGGLEDETRGVTGGEEELEKDFAGERPQHQVTLTRPFYLGRYEVTLAQWRAVMGTDPAFISDPVPGNQRNSFPVWGVSHVMIAGGDGLNGPQTFLGRTGCRLPTEAEWEYACRAGTRTPFSFGATISPDQANYSTNYVHDEQTTWESLLEGLRALVEPEDPTPMQMTTPVARYPGNPWGLHDMHGNVQEWCADWYDEGLYAACKDGVTDPKGPSIGSTRVVRGGAWYEDAAFLRSAFRDSFPPSFLFFGLGFRVARDP